MTQEQPLQKKLIITLILALVFAIAINVWQYNRSKNAKTEAKITANEIKIDSALMKASEVKEAQQAIKDTFATSLSNHGKMAVKRMEEAGIKRSKINDVDLLVAADSLVNYESLNK